MRDPELMQRADRAAIALEEAWERWRAMHGLGTEPLPPVSSYVGYSLEEPWGQPRVVFGLRADEAELLATLLDGHDCVGPIYAEVSTRPGWRQPVNGPASQLNRPYGVPAQAPPSPLDQVGLADLAAVDDIDDIEDGADDLVAAGPDGDGLAEAISESEAVAADGEPARSSKAKARRPGSKSEAQPENGNAEASGVKPGSLTQLPDVAGSRRAEEEAASGDQARPALAKRTPGRASVPARGPGYRGPRYQGGRYDAGTAARKAEQLPDSDDDEQDAEPAAQRRSHVAKLSRSRRRASSG